MSGTGHDLSAGTFNQDGRIFQIEYAEKCLESKDTIVGVKCSDGIILGVVKYLESLLLVPDANNVIHTVDTHLGAITTGLQPDGRYLVDRARQEANGYRQNFGLPIPTAILAQRMSRYMQVHTMHHGARPFGTAFILAGCDLDKYALYMIEPSGKCYGYKGCTAGKNKQTTKNDLEKEDFSKMTCREALPLVAKMLCNGVKDERDKEKRYEFEASWICNETNSVHHFIDKESRVICYLVMKLI